MRIQFPGAIYHVMNRSRTFLKAIDYETFLTTLEEGCQLFNVKLYAFCLMPNHYHLLVCTPSGNLSRFMRHLNGVYTQRFNREHHRDGPLFRGRYKGILVQEDSYLIEVVRYIHKNPLKAKMVERLSQFKWSSHKTYTGKKESFAGLDTNFVLEYFSRNRRKAIEGYKRFMSQSEDEVIEKFYSSKKQGSILGDLDFIERIKNKYILKDLSPDLEVKEIRRLCGERVIRKIKREVCKVFKVRDKHLSQGQRGTSNIPRRVALSLSKELSGLKLSEICGHFMITSRQTVGGNALRLRNMMKNDKVLRKKYSSLKATCSQGTT